MNKELIKLLKEIQIFACPRICGESSEYEKCGDCLLYINVNKILTKYGGK